MPRAPMQIKTALFRCMLPALAAWLGAPQALLSPALSAPSSVDGVVFAHNQPGKGVASILDVYLKCPHPWGWVGLGWVE